MGENGDMPSMEIIGTASWGRKRGTVPVKEEATVSLRLPRKTAQACCLCPQRKGMHSPSIVFGHTVSPVFVVTSHKGMPEVSESF